MNTNTCGRKPPPRLAFTLSEFCHSTGLSRTAAYAAIARGELQTFKNGRRRFVRATAAQAWLDAREMNQPRMKPRRRSNSDRRSARPE